MSRKPDKFMRDMRRIQGERRRQRARRERRDLYRDDGPGVIDHLEDAAQDLKLKGREASALARGVGRGVAREMGSLGAGMARETGKLAIDLFIGALSLGMVDPSNPGDGHRSSPPRRRRPRRR